MKRGFTLRQSEVDKIADLDRTIDGIEKNDAWNDSDEVVQLEVKKPLDKVIPIRLSKDKWEEIRQEAKELGVGPTTLVRMWVLDHLRQRVKT